MLRTLRVVLATFAVQIVVFGAVASAHTTVVTDAEGDVAAAAPGYVDILQVKVTEQVGRGMLVFSYELAAPVPETPSGFLAYNTLIDLPGGNVGAADTGFVLRWCTQAQLPACASGPAHWEAGRVVGPGNIAEPYEFKLSGATVKVYVPAASIGDPSTFSWFSATRLAPAPSGQPPVDFAPDTGWATLDR